MRPVRIGILEGRLTPSNGRGVQFFPYETWESEFAYAQEIGLDCIEVLIQRKDWGNPAHPLLSADGISKIRDAATKTGVKTPSVHAYYEPRETFPLEMDTIAHAAEKIGASVVLLSFFKHAALDSQETKEIARKYLSAALARLGEVDVRFGLEAELPAEELLEFIEALSEPEKFGVYYDLGNQYALEFPVAEELRLLGDKVFGVHVKDRLPQKAHEAESPSVPLGTGCANSPEAFSALKDISYAGPLIIQGARQEGRNDVEVVKEYYEFVKRLAINP